MQDGHRACEKMFGANVANVHRSCGAHATSNPGQATSPSRLWSRNATISSRTCPARLANSNVAPSAVMIEDRSVTGPATEISRRRSIVHEPGASSDDVATLPPDGDQGQPMTDSCVGM